MDTHLLSYKTTKGHVYFSGYFAVNLVGILKVLLVDRKASNQTQNNAMGLSWSQRTGPPPFSPKLLNTNETKREKIVLIWFHS